MTYRQRSLEWKEKAEALPSDKDRDVFIAIADGYAQLARLHENEIQPKGTADHRRDHTLWT